MTINPATFNDWVIYKGATWAEIFRIKINGVYQDLSASIIVLTCKAAKGQGVPLFTLTTADDSILISDDGTTASWALSAGDTEALPGIAAVYQIDVTTDGITNRWQEGNLTFTAGV